LAFIYQEALRGLLHQQNVVEALNTRAGNVIFAASFATSLLGTVALSDGPESNWDHGCQGNQHRHPEPIYSRRATVSRYSMTNYNVQHKECAISKCEDVA
jgi:hypothetical protein